MWILWTLLSTLSWAMINVLDSILVHRFERHPLALMWSQTFVSIPILLLLAFAVPLKTEWVYFLLLFGVLGYIGDAWFFHVLAHLDVSVSNVAWSILSLLLAAAGFFLFHDAWGPMQTTASVLIIGAAFMLSGFHQGVRLRHAFLLIFILAGLYLPYYIAKKHAIDSGVQPAMVFFWMLAGREALSFLTPLIVPSVRRIALVAIRTSPWFMILNAGVIVLFFFAEFMGVLAYRDGDLSLVSILTNTQPFMVMAIAWLVVRMVPSHAAKELLTRQSVSVKVASFSLVFLGLALLGISQ